MKKGIAAFLIVFCWLLSGCVSKIPTQPSDSAALSNATQSNSGNTSVDDLKPIPGMDAQNKYLMTTTLGFQETDNSFCGSNMGGNYLQYYDKASGVSGVLCADPACTHDAADCGARIESGASLSVYDGQLYWIGKSADSGSDFILWCSDLSGMNRKAVIRLSYQDVIMKYQPQRFVIHRGNLYLQGCANAVVGTTVGLRITLLSISLDGSGDLTILYDQSFENGVEPTMRFVGNFVYFSVRVFKGEDYDLSITRFNARTGGAEIIYAATGMTEVPGPIWVDDQGEVYLPTADTDHAYVWKLENRERIFVVSWEGENLSAPKLGDGVAITIGREDGVRTVSIKSLGGTTIYEGLLFPEGIPGVEGDPNEYYYGIVGADENKIIMQLQSAVDSNMDYTIMLDLYDNLKPTILWSTHE